MLADLNGGLVKLGFVKTTFQEEYKVRPDYATQTLFVAHRQDVPEFKHFWTIIKISRLKTDANKSFKVEMSMEWFFAKLAHEPLIIDN